MNTKNSTSMKCENCIHWSKIDGTKKNKNEQGLCEFLNNRVDRSYHPTDKKPEPSPKNNSLVINSSAEVSAEIGGFSISSTDPKVIMSHVWAWTDAKFFCAAFTVE